MFKERKRRYEFVGLQYENQVVIALTAISQ